MKAGIMAERAGMAAGEAESERAPIGIVGMVGAVMAGDTMMMDGVTTASTTMMRIRPSSINGLT